jgi:riboflavin synthase
MRSVMHVIITVMVQLMRATYVLRMVVDEDDEMEDEIITVVMVD